MYPVLWVALGGALGSAGRYGVNLAADRLVARGLPWATFTVNVLGSLLIGIVAATIMRKMPEASNLRFFVATGVLGGFTTFSAFSLDVLKLVQGGEARTAVFYVFATVVLSIAAVFAGFWIAAGLT